MNNLTMFILKLFSQLRIPSERETRDLQRRQVKCALEQSNNLNNGATDAQPNNYQADRPMTTPLNTKRENKIQSIGNRTTEMQQAS